ncbi:MAG: 1-deoxy-D-xylulose-5-phosphate reductoisomerase [Spirochaetaceae bacterium]|jgi:1-deoxy-D-xylulose-5-phosphate reductoisomerase|nr:1-deoxy-D-xylulose-5-phosphate reductoisomerase [Spirochaetaceae bacterium]
MKKRVAVLGATGSIGKSTIDVLREGKEYFDVVLLSSHRDVSGLAALSREFPAADLALTGANAELGGVCAANAVYRGKEGLLQAIARIAPDITVNGIAGAAGLEPSLAALDAGSDLALANKETVVMAAPLVFARAKKTGRRILPVDSEHHAVSSLMEARGRENAVEIILTASGGPFRTRKREDFARITVEEALAHPTWNMGPKITLDSASLANKGLEVIEAAGLFTMPPDRITVVIHPQSIVHSMVRLKDGGVYAQLSQPDMRLPIHNALYYPVCTPCSLGRLDFTGLTLNFEAPDFAAFPMLPLAYEAAKRGGLYPAVYNAANEAAAAAFLAKTIGFLDIPRIVEYVLNTGWDTSGDFESGEALRVILEADETARNIAAAYISEKNLCS